MQIQSVAFFTLRKIVDMDPNNSNFKTRLDDLENQIEELRTEIKIDVDIEAKLEELRDKLKETEQDEQFFLWIKNKGLTKGVRLSKVLHRKQLQANAFMNEENLQKLQKDPKYCKMSKRRKLMRQYFSTGLKYLDRLKEERKNLKRKIHQLELRRLQIQLAEHKNCNS